MGEMSAHCRLRYHVADKGSHNKLFLGDQGQLSRRLLAQPPCQLALAPEQERYASYRHLGKTNLASKNQKGQSRLKPFD